MRQIALTQGKFAIVDNKDYLWLNKWKWTCLGGKAGIGKRRKKWYAYRQEFVDGKYKMILMHRLIMNARFCDEVDHKNANGLDNTRDNLRKCNRKQQMGNMRGWINAEVNYKGVSLSNDGKRKKKYRARIRINGKETIVGRYLTAIEAAVAYDRAVLKEFKEFARTNFQYQDERGLKFKLKRKIN